MSIFNKKMAAGVIVAAALLPLMASAQTTDVQSQIQSLLSQIKALQQQLATLLQQQGGSGERGPWMMSSTTPPQGGAGTPPGQAAKAACVALNRNLGLGSRGDDVKSLQEMLGEDPENGFEGAATGFFGPLTAKAMMRFQTRMGIASSTTGAVGPITRGFFERECGKGLEGAGQNGGDARLGFSGTITANNGSTITIQNRDNKSVTVNVSASTTIMVVNGTSTPPTTGSPSDLIVGKVAAAEGPRNQDGSIQAIRITVGTIPPPPVRGGDGPRSMMPTINGPRGDEGDGRGGPQNW